MKLLLVTVIAIAVFAANSNSQVFSSDPVEQDITIEAQLIPDTTKGQGGTQQSRNEPTQDQQLEEQNGKLQRKLRRSKCHARNACVIMGGFCVTNATLCGGRLVPEGCKGSNCQCCIPGTLEAKLDQLEDTINNIYSNISSMLESQCKNKAVCPLGFFNVPESGKQCFKFFPNRIITWEASKLECKANGLELAKLNDPATAVALRKFIVETYGDKRAWVGGRGTGSNVEWVRDGTTALSSSSPAFYPGLPSSSTGTSYCLYLVSTSDHMRKQPTKPYYMTACSNAGSVYLLCEYVM